MFFKRKKLLFKELFQALQSKDLRKMQIIIELIKKDEKKIKEEGEKEDGNQ